MGSVRATSSWAIWRPVPVDDGAGGQAVTMVNTREERGDVRKLAGRELIEAQQAAAEHTHVGHFRGRADIVRNDELRSAGETLLVLTVTKTFPGDTRLRVTARSIEAGG